jgi:tRNA-dihydrouridine synthase A
MITAKAIIFGDKNRLLDFNAVEHPLVLQLGGSNPSEMAHATKIAKDWGYDEVNINVGCPSNRVQSGHFGACLMLTPEIVADCVKQMKQVVDIPISVKCRIGVDEQDSYQALTDFIHIISEAGCNDFTLHARKAWLKGLSPKENRSVPEINYKWVYQIKRDFPQLIIAINGGIMNMDEACQHLQQVDGVMLGRAVYHQPYLLSEVDGILEKTVVRAPTREQILIDFISYMEQQKKQGVPIRTMTRHILGLYHSQPKAKRFRQLLSGKVVEIAHLHQYLAEVENGS